MGMHTPGTPLGSSSANTPVVTPLQALHAAAGLPLLPRRVRFAGGLGPVGTVNTPPATISSTAAEAAVWAQQRLSLMHVIDQQKQYI
eukprot:390350-Rhodomonas_salina.2